MRLSLVSWIRNLFQVGDPDPTPLTAAQLDAIIHSHFGSALEGAAFSMTGRRRWVRSRCNEFRDVFEIASLKGGRCYPRWGLSLNYCPQIKGKKIHFHRTEKSAQIDVVWDPIDYVDAPSRAMESWVFDSLWTKPRKASSQAGKVAKKAVPRALTWFSGNNSVDDIITVLEAKKTEKVYRFGFANYVQQPLALALSYAQIGNSVRAAQLLEEYIVSYEVLPEAAQRLRSMIVSQTFKT